MNLVLVYLVEAPNLERSLQIIKCFKGFDILRSWSIRSIRSFFWEATTKPAWNPRCTKNSQSPNCRISCVTPPPRKNSWKTVPGSTPWSWSSGAPNTILHHLPAWVLMIYGTLQNHHGTLVTPLLWAAIGSPFCRFCLCIPCHRAWYSSCSNVAPSL